jgi:hypothetical protein
MKIREDHAPQIREAVAMGLKSKEIQKTLGIAKATLKSMCEDLGIDYRSICTQPEASAASNCIYPAKDVGSVRLYIARCFRISRSGGNLSECLNTVSGGIYNDKSIYGLVGTHCTLYNTISKKRRDKSKYNDHLIETKEKSKLYKMESDFRDALAKEYKGEVEVRICGQQRCDVVAVIGGIKYAIECKTTTRGLNIEECVGQALFASYHLKLKPAVAFPPDTVMDEAHKEWISSMGVYIVPHKGELPNVNNTKEMNEEFWSNGMRKKWKKIKGTDKANIFDMTDEGFTARQISSCLGESRMYVISKMNQHRLKDDVLTFHSKMKDTEAIQLEMKYA